MSRTRAHGHVGSAPREVSRGFGGDHCLAPARSADAPVDGASGRYGRMFPGLPALAGEGEALLALGRAGSYLASEPSWTPTLPARGERFGLTDLLLATDAKGRLTPTGARSEAERA